MAQSHASRHVVSEKLQDLHPDLSEPFLKEIIKNEVSTAYGRRGVEKLIAVLALEPGELPDDKRAHALRVFCGLLSTQEQKTDALHGGAAAPLTRLVRELKSVEVHTLCCQALGSLAHVRAGRAAIVEADGMASLIAALQTTPEAAADAFRQFSTSTDGIAHLQKVHDDLVPALVTLITYQPGKPEITLLACRHATDTLAGIASNDTGIVSCLVHHVPAAVVQLAVRCLQGDLSFDTGTMDALAVCATCMEQIAHHAYGKTALREADAIKQLSSMLVHCKFHPEALVHSVAALMGCSVEKESKVPCILYAGKHLVTMLKTGTDERHVSNARAALVSCCEHLEARAIVQALLTEAEMKDILYKGPLPDTPPDFRYKVILASTGKSQAAA